MKPTIKPLGVGDLKVVKQKLARYEAGEIAHIENIMMGESRSRKHRRLQQREELLELEQERTEESVRDLQSTERFEMEQESKQTIRSEASFQAGVDITGGYGPVRVTSSAKYVTNNAKEESNSNSTKYAKDVTDKTLSRLVEKVRQLRRTRTLEEIEETNEHGFDNTAGEEHKSGIYRWVDKYYRAKTVDYGRRLMYEFFVPEPAAFYIFATRYNLDTHILPIKPKEPTVSISFLGLTLTVPLSPGLINRKNYLTLVQQNNAEGVQPPPPASIVIAKSIAKENPNGNFWSFSDEELKIPKGYEARIWYFNGAGPVKKGEQNEATFIIGTTGRVTFPKSKKPSKEPIRWLRNETGSVPIAGSGHGYRALFINIEVQAQLTIEYYQKWQLETYTAIMNAYHKALMDYEERVAAAQISQGEAIGSDNPEINREIEKQELKRSCLTLWAGQCFDNPPGINHSPGAMPPSNYPQINIANATANATTIEFFEAAFDWENITYEFLPYFWARKSQWIDILALESSDPIFEQFLKAGAARVVVPVKPAYVDAVLYYQLTGNIWTGGSAPPLSDANSPEAVLYNSYLDELADVTDISDIDHDIELLPTDETTWEIKVPTTLVWLQDSSSELPDLEREEK